MVTHLFFTMSNNDLNKLNDFPQQHETPFNICAGRNSNEPKLSEPIFSLVNRASIETNKYEHPICFVLAQNDEIPRSLTLTTPVMATSNSLNYSSQTITNAENSLQASPIILRNAQQRSSPDCLQEHMVLKNNGSNITLVSIPSNSTQNDALTLNQSFHSAEIPLQKSTTSQEERLVSIENGIIDIKKKLNECLENQSHLFNLFSSTNIQKGRKSPENANIQIQPNILISSPISFQNSEKSYTFYNNSPNLNTPSESPIYYHKVHLDTSNSPSQIEPYLMAYPTNRSLSKFPSHSCSMYNKSIRDLSNPNNIEWPNDCVNKLGANVTVDQIKEVLAQTNTITHFTAEFQKVVFTSEERKTLTTSGKFRKRKLDRVVLGQLDPIKLQAIIELSIFLFGVTLEDEQRVKYQLKQAIDEKNRREFYREDRGSKRLNLMANHSI